MKSKTLKELFLEYHGDYEAYKFIRQSAIEDIKELRKGYYLQINNGLPVTDSRSLTFRDVDKKALILWIMWKFNITKEDLE